MRFRFFKKKITAKYIIVWGMEYNDYRGKCHAGDGQNWWLQANENWSKDACWELQEAFPGNIVTML